MNRFDIDWVRSQFPGLTGAFAYLDNAGGSLPAHQVIDRITAYLRETPVQLGASYPASRLASERLDAAVAAVAELVQATPAELVMGPSTSALLYRLSMAMSHQLGAGDEIVVTDADHEANVTPWRRLVRLGVTVRTWRVNRDTGEFDCADLSPLLNARTRLVCVTHVSNVTGSITPLAEVTRLAHEAGARVCIDGVAHAPHRLLTLKDWDVDFYAFSFYKVFGPHHAVLYGKHEALAGLDNINHDFFSRDDVPYKLQPGSHCYELSCGCHGIVDYLDALAVRHGVSAALPLAHRLAAAYAVTTAYETQLTERLLDYLRARTDIRLIGHPTADPARRVSTVSFVAAGRDSATIPAHIDTRGIGIRYGDFYAPRLIDALGLAEVNGVVRVSMIHYNTLDEIDRLCTALDQVLADGRLAAG